MRFNQIKEFIRLESSAGILLLLMAIFAMLIDNSAWSVFYERFFDTPFSLQFGDSVLKKPVILWVNEGLVSIFFFLVGLEIKREVLVGNLNSISRIMLPAITAVGGMVVPALIYIVLNRGDSQALPGWAIPVATDIAFSLGILAVLGKRIPLSLKVFLTALAIFDDIGAILIIAIYYSHHMQFVLLSGALGCLCVLLLMNRFKVAHVLPYLFVGIIMWFFVLESGVHATLTGVLLAMTIPLSIDGQRSPARHLEKKLHPWVAWFVLPVFAFANSGVPFADIQAQQLLHNIPLGIALGLVLGKPIGIFSAAWIGVKMGVARLPERSNWMSLLGVACICGVGFTMSLFIGTLAFGEANAMHEIYVRVGVLSGSLISGILGYLILHHTHPSVEQPAAIKESA